MMSLDMFGFPFFTLNISVRIWLRIINGGGSHGLKKSIVSFISLFVFHEKVIG